MVLALLAPSDLLAAPLAASDPLAAEIVAADAIVFDDGFNNCKTGALDAIVADDLEFYHDVGGAILGKAAFVESIETGICKSAFKPRRALVAGSLEIYPMLKDGALYAAIESGVHQFFETPPGGAERLTGVAQFTILWRKEPDGWKMSRVLSFDHGPAK